jgi:UDP-glucose 4-epimerase
MVSSLVLITGGAGFIGSNLIAYLLKEGRYRIQAFDNLSVGRKYYIEQILNSLNLAGSKNSIEFIEADIRNKEQVEEAVKGVDAVVHLAAHTNVTDSLEDPEKDFVINAKGTLNLLEACRKHGVDRFLFASSNAVVGEQIPPIDEGKVPVPLSPYGASKLAGEGLCSAYYRSFGIKTTSLRFSNAYGPYSEHKISVVAKFIRRAREGQPLVIYGDGHQTRDFIHTLEICQAISLALEQLDSDEVAGQVFQIASGVETDIIELAQTIRSLARQAGLQTPDVVFEPPRRGEIQRNYARITRAQTILGFTPNVTLEDGLKDLWAYMEARLPAI